MMIWAFFSILACSLTFMLSSMAFFLFFYISRSFCLAMIQVVSNGLVSSPDTFLMIYHSVAVSDRLWIIFAIQFVWQKVDGTGDSQKLHDFLAAGLFKKVNLASTLSLKVSEIDVSKASSMLPLAYSNAGRTSLRLSSR